MSAIGQFLHADTSSSYYTPWEARGGNSAVMVLEVMAAAITAGHMLVTVQTKNSEDDDSAPTTLGDFSYITTASGTPYTFYATGFKELYRLKVSFASTASSDWVHFRDLAPSWLWN